MYLTCSQGTFRGQSGTEQLQSTEAQGRGSDFFETEKRHRAMTICHLKVKTMTYGRL